MKTTVILSILSIVLSYSVLVYNIAYHHGKRDGFKKFSWLLDELEKEKEEDNGKD